MDFNCFLFRKALALYIAFYYLPFLNDLLYTFGADGMVSRDLLGPLYAPSLLFLSGSKTLIYGGMLTVYTLALLLFLEKLPRLGIFALYLCNVSFQNANPYILHEPQQMASFLLLIQSFFLPTSKKETCDPFVWKTLLVVLGVYYFFAGFKKILDPLWFSGDALYYLLQWETLGRISMLSDFFLQFPGLLKVLNYLTLIFEMSFLVGVFTPYFRYYWYLGLAFHMGIAIFFVVGTFTPIMFVWYALFYPKESLYIRFASLFEVFQTKESTT